MTENFENVNHLVLNFYPDGYSIAVKLNEFPVFTSETILETAKISYEETSLLDYIENEELPPLLVEMIDSSPKLSQYKIWHNGCLIMEVRDKIDPHNDRIESTNNKQTNSSFFILLKPTNLSMLYDVFNLTGSKCWSTQERLQLESQIVLHNSPSLLLDPDVPETSSDLVTLWPFLRSAKTNMAASSNKYSRLSGQLFHKERLKDIYVNRPVTLTNQVKNNGNCKKGINNHNNYNSKLKNLSISQPTLDSDAATSDSLPPELTLQQFLAAKRTTKKIALPFGHSLRFHRFKRYSKCK